MRKEKNPNSINYYEEDKTVGFITFENNDGVLLVTQTFVNPEYRNQKIASLLVKDVIEFARDNNFKIKPLCSYVVHYFEKNKEDSDLLVS